MRRVMLFLTVTFMIVAVVSGQNQNRGGTFLTYTPPDPTSPVPGELVRKLPLHIAMSCKAAGQALPQPFAGTGFLVRIAVPPPRNRSHSIIWLRIVMLLNAGMKRTVHNRCCQSQCASIR